MRSNFHSVTKRIIDQKYCLDEMFFIVKYKYQPSFHDHLIVKVNVNDITFVVKNLSKAIPLPKDNPIVGTHRLRVYRVCVLS